MTHKNILICVCGGIAAYKIVTLTSLLRKSGAVVKVFMTENATELVSPTTFQALSSNPVFKDTFKRIYPMDLRHEKIIEDIDLCIVAPATGNMIGKLNRGIGDDLVSHTLMNLNIPIVMVPSMNTDMYLNPIVQHNIEELKDLGYHFMKPGFGKMSLQSEPVGTGRLPEPGEIFEYVQSFFDKNL